MNTIPLIFNEREIKRTVLGGTEKNSKAKFPVGVVLLTRDVAHYKTQTLDMILDCGFESVVSIETSKDNYQLESLSQQYSCVKFILPLEKLTIGDMINIGISELDSPYALVMWDDIQIKPRTFSSYFINKIFENDFLVTCPFSVDKLGNLILSTMIPSVNKNNFTFTPIIPVYNGTKTAYPFDFVGIYNTDRFMKLGGFDYTITSSYWQNADFGLRAWLWNEKIIQSSDFKLAYDAEHPKEETTVDFSYFRFYLKNLAPVYRSDSAYIPRSKYLPFCAMSHLNIFDALSEFKQTRKWVMKNRYKFVQDVTNLLNSWIVQK